MQHASQAKYLTVFLSLTAALLAGDRLLAAERTSSPSPAKPSAVKPSYSNGNPYVPFSTGTSASYVKAAPSPTAALEKLKDLGAHLGRALDIAVDLFSGNEAELLSKNKTALLSGNRPTILSGNNPKVLSENATPILSGNTFSVLSNIRVEIHIENSGNNACGAPQPAVMRMNPRPEPSQTAPPSRGR